jgi:hypothetical protein
VDTPATSSSPTRYSQSREESRWVPNGKRSGLPLVEAGDLKETIQVGAKIPIARRGSIEGRADPGASPVRRMR